MMVPGYWQWVSEKEAKRDEAPIKYLGAGKKSHNKK
jgi:hypothetical protein